MVMNLINLALDWVLVRLGIAEAGTEAGAQINHPAPLNRVTRQGLRAELARLTSDLKLELGTVDSAIRAAIRPRRAAVEALATALLDRRVLDGAEAEAIVRRMAPAGSAQP